MADPKATIRLGAKDETGPAFASVQRSIDKLALSAKTQGKGAREAKLLELASQGATRAQLAQADAALKLNEAYRRGEEIGRRIRSTFVGIGTGAVLGTIAAAAAFDRLIKSAGDYQDISEKIGDSAANVASIAVPVAVAGASMETISAFSIKLSKNLTEVTDDSKAAGAALKALGIDLNKFKDATPVDRLETLAKALEGFEDGDGKTQVMEALARGGAELLPLMKELAQEGARQTILTKEQIRVADEYADSQARTIAQIRAHAQAIALDALPMISQFTQALRDIASDQEIAAAATDLLKGSISGAITFFQTIAVVGSDVIFVIEGVTEEVRTLTRQMQALLQLDFSSFLNGASSIATLLNPGAAAARMLTQGSIGEAAKIGEDARKRAEEKRSALDKFQARIMGIGQTPPPDQQPRTTGDFARADRAATPPARPRLRFTGARDKGAGNAAAQEARAQLGFDLELIRRESEGMRAILEGDEKILEARRAAGLVTEREYYRQKRDLMAADQQEQERALEREIARLEQEKASGREKIENDRKVLEARQKLAKLRNQGEADVKVLGIQEAAAIERTTRAYSDATIAAREYLDTIARRGQRELAGIGRGERFRQRQAGADDIEDKFLAERSRLERDRRNQQITPQEFDLYLQIARRTYEAETALYRQRTDAMERMQGDWTIGFSESLENYLDQARNTAQQSQEIFDNAFRGLEDAITEFATTGKASLKDLANSVAAMVTRMGARQLIAAGAEGLKGSDFFGGIFKSLAGAGNTVANAAGAAPAAASLARPVADAAQSVQTAATIAGALAPVTASAAALASAETGAATAIAAASASSSAALASLTAAEAAAATAIATASTTSSAALAGLAAAAGSAAAALGTVAATSAAGSGGGGIVSAIFGGGRAHGGPVAAGKLYEVNELGRPELLEVAGRQYLMTGSEGGKVTNVPTGQGAGGPVNQYHLTVQLPPGASRQTGMQIGRDMARELHRATAHNGR